MAIFSGSQYVNYGDIVGAIIDLESCAYSTPSVLAIELIMLPATTVILGLGKAANTPNQTAPQRLDGESHTGTSSTGQSLSTIGQAWGTAPTVPANFFRRISIASTFRTGAIYTFSRGIRLPVSTSLCLWQTSQTGGFGTVFFEIDE